MGPGPGSDGRAERTAARSELVAQLQRAHAGELAAALAYRGHWRSLRAGVERDTVRRIEQEEWHHRRLVGEMLVRLGARPRNLREAVHWAIGSSLGLGCHIGGWLLPMLGAGRLETRNVAEYELAAELAITAGEADLVPCLAIMSEVEREHEDWFRARVSSHRFGARLSRWRASPPRAPGPRASRELPASLAAASAAERAATGAPRAVVPGLDPQLLRP
jgi:demethoxyubiquinone hydroxylase (CLK1/Coq7/Cat5 family)